MQDIGNTIYAVGMFLMSPAGWVVDGIIILLFFLGAFERIDCEIKCAVRGPAYRIEHARIMFSRMNPTARAKLMATDKGRQQRAALERDIKELNRLQTPEPEIAYGLGMAGQDTQSAAVEAEIAEIMGYRFPTVISTETGSSTQLTNTFSDGIGVTPDMSGEGIYATAAKTGMSQREISDQLEYAQWLANEGYTADYVRNSTALPLHVDSHGKVHIDN